MIDKKKLIDALQEYEGSGFVVTDELLEFIQKFKNDISPPIPDNHILVGEIENPNRISHLALRGLTRGGNLKGLYLLPKGCIKSVYCLDIKRGDTVIETLTYSSESKYNHDIAIFT